MDGDEGRTDVLGGLLSLSDIAVQEMRTGYCKIPKLPYLTPLTPHQKEGQEKPYLAFLYLLIPSFFLPS